MSIPPAIVAITREAWKWEWNQLMKGLAPADKDGNFKRVPSQKINAIAPIKKDLLNRAKNECPMLIVGRSCPWAHRTWLVYQIRELKDSLGLMFAQADHQGGRWLLEPSWMGCNSLLDLYKICGTPPNHRATVPAIIDPKPSSQGSPELIGNESAQLVEALNQWPAKENAPDLFPQQHEEEINHWSNILQAKVNDGVYKCGFARNQKAYEKASEELFTTLELVERKLREKGPWLCGDVLTLADIRLFPTLIRWESIYAPLFKCNQKPLWQFPKIWGWRQRFFNMPQIEMTCDAIRWREDYFGALFPLNPSNIIPAASDLRTIVNSEVPNTQKIK